MVRDHLWKNPFWTPFSPIFCSKNGPFSRHLEIFHGAKCVTKGSKFAQNTCESILSSIGSLLEKHFFDPFLIIFWSQNGPFSRHFGIFRWRECVNACSKSAKKHVFDPFPTYFCSQNGPFSKHFGIFHGPKRVITVSN